MGIICNDEKISKNPKKDIEPKKKKKTIESKTKKIVDNSNYIEMNKELINEFMNKEELQNSFYETDIQNDQIYYGLKNYEKEELEKEFRKIIHDYENDVLKKGSLRLQNNDELISNIIKNEESEKIFKRKIIDNIKSIKNNDNEFKIDYLTILLVGRKGIGKTTLINYMLELNGEEPNNQNKGNNSKDNFVTYKSNYVPYLKLVEFKGIGYDKDSNPKTIGMQTVKYIEEHIKKEEGNNGKKKKNCYNDFVHCIWYCVSGTRFEKPEIAVLKELQEVYKDNIMPIILVYTQTVNKETAKEMLDYINKQTEGIISVQVLAEDKELTDGTIKEAFGKEKLLEKTLIKCTKTLKGKMIKFMTVNISDTVKDIMLKLNEENEKKIKEKIIKDFVEKYHKVQKDDQFISYIIDILVKNLHLFYNDDYLTKMSNKSFNLLNKSEIIINIKKFINDYKFKTKERIKKIIEEKANEFIDKQAKIEKENKNNIFIENKRRLKGFKKTNEIFLKKNIYFISQKYIINYIIQNFCENYFRQYRKKLDKFIITFLKNTNINGNNNQDNENEIKNNLEDCFLTKLKNFAVQRKINVEINLNSDKMKKTDTIEKENTDDEDLFKNNLNTHSFDLGYNYNDSDNETTEKKTIKNDNNLFPIKIKNWKYLKNEKINLLENFLNKNDIQDSYFEERTNDEAFNSLKDYIKNDLVSYFNNNNKQFINNIDNVYNKKEILYDKSPISKIMEFEEISSIYKKKIEKEFLNIENDHNFCKIDYLSIILVGRSGVGKSTLINSMLKEDLAEEGAGDIVTTIQESYQNKIIPFLRFIDTRGIELKKKYGPNQILKNTNDLIEKEKKTVENNKQNFNNYIQCIWYCIKDSNIENKEIEVINNLIKQNKNIPLIIVCTNAFDKKNVEKIKIIISENFGDIPIISVLGKPIKNTMKSYGLDQLLNLTLEECKKSVKGDIFKKMKEKIINKIINNFNKINNEIKKEANNNLVSTFINDYKKVINNKEIPKFIINLLKIIFIEYKKSDNDNNKEHLCSDSINELEELKTLSFIKDYIKFCEHNTKKKVDLILKTKPIEYLDIQVKKEIKEFNKSLDINHKQDKQDFIKIIQNFLNENFYYLSQKYIIYRFITDISEPFSEEIETQINKIINKILISKDTNESYIQIYNKKFKDFISMINSFRKERQEIYYETNNDINKNINKTQKQNNDLKNKPNNQFNNTNNNIFTNDNTQVNTKNNNNYQKKRDSTIYNKNDDEEKKVIDIDCPEGPYPKNI